MRDLLSKKNADLKKVVDKLGIQCDNVSANSIMRKAIWEHFNGNLNLKEVEIDIAKEDAKKIWENLSSYTPQNSLFQADRRNSDDDSEVQDPLKMAVKEIFTRPGNKRQIKFRCQHRKRETAGSSRPNSKKNSRKWIQVSQVP